MCFLLICDMISNDHVDMISDYHMHDRACVCDVRWRDIIKVCVRYCFTSRLWFFVLVFLFVFFCCFFALFCHTMVTPMGQAALPMAMRR